MNLLELRFKLRNIKTGEIVYDEAVSKINLFDGTIDVEINEDGDDETFDLCDFDLLRSTGINDIDGDEIYEFDIVNQKSVLLGDEEIDFTGEVKILEGQWMIIDEENKNAIPLWSEHRENKIIKEDK